MSLESPNTTTAVMVVGQNAGTKTVYIGGDSDGLAVVWSVASKTRPNVIQESVRAEVVRFPEDVGLPAQLAPQGKARPPFFLVASKTN